MKRKKRILRVGCKIKAMGMLATALLIANVAIGSVLAGPTSDIYNKYHNSGYGFATNTLEKNTTSSVYISHEKDAPIKVQVCSYGVNYTYGNYYVLKPGESRYMGNSVVENGRNNCYLLITPTYAGNHYLKGYWKADTGVF